MVGASVHTLQQASQRMKLCNNHVDTGLTVLSIFLWVLQAGDPAGDAVCAG